MCVVEALSIQTLAMQANPMRDRGNRRELPFWTRPSSWAGIVLLLASLFMFEGLASAGEPSGPRDPDLKLGATCSGAPSADVLRDALPTYIKELVVQWPRAGKRKSESGCVSVARMTIFDHLAVPLTLSIELHPSPLAPPSPDYVLPKDHNMPRAVFLTQPSPEYPSIRITLAGPPAAARDSLERALDFIDGPALAKRFASLK